VANYDEIGEVATAFTAVHRSAVRLAAEQAMMRRAVNAMFVNLARRSQTLVERQLRLLDTLEAAETDPDQLSNLFRLDHLATRMRRNDENLLVLAGGDGSRRWPEPVSLAAVVLAAMAEIEQYPRIRHDVTGDVHVVGHAVADVVHLLAELLENATAFSPPDSTVTVTGWRGDDRSGSPAEGAHPTGSGVTLVIQDHGIGMTADSVGAANQRLARPMAIDVAASERMGLVVVGHLAARHRIAVELRGSTEGVTAYVWLPGQLLAQPSVHRIGLFPGATSPATAAALAEHTDGTTDGTLVGAGARRSLPGAAGPSAGPTAAPPAASVPLTPVLPTVGPGPAIGPVTGNGMTMVRGSGRARATTAGPTPPAPLRRPAPPVQPAEDTGTRWFTRGTPDGGPGRGPGGRAAQPPRVPAPRQPMDGGTSTAGLPVRVPMAQLPVSGESTVPIKATPPPKLPYAEPDPSQVGSMLSRFYSGVHRATAEEQGSLG